MGAASHERRFIAEVIPTVDISASVPQLSAKTVQRASTSDDHSGDTATIREPPVVFLPNLLHHATMLMVAGLIFVVAGTVIFGLPLTLLYLLYLLLRLVMPSWVH